MSSSGENFDIANVSGSESDFLPAPKKAKAVAKSNTKSEPKPPKPAASKQVSKPKATVKPQPKVLADVDENAEDIDEDSDTRPPVPRGDKKEKTVDEKFQKLTQVEHILKRPDSYIGSVEMITQLLWVYDSENQRMEHREVKYVPGFFKIVDEILVNAADNKVNDPNMDTLKVEIDVESETISVFNNGKGIPIEIHSATKLYVPELIFGHLLSSSNYDDSEKKLTGGRNGYGAKLTNIYSHEFTVETADKNTGQKYKQRWTNNMGKCEKAKITKNGRNEEYTKVTFRPDLKRFGMESIDKDAVALMKKRVYDMAGTINDVKVFLNGDRVKVKGFKSYAEMFVNSVAAGVAEQSGGAAPAKLAVIHEKIGSRWEVAFTVSDGTFQQLSFANSIATTKGGTHVNLIADQIAKNLVATITKKNKAATVKIPQVKNHMWLFVNALVENPTFDSQTKETLTLPSTKFGTKPVLSEEFMRKVSKSAIVEHVLDWAKFKADKEIKKTDGRKQNRITGLAKLCDANNAGTKHADQCTLILTEGDSAKALAVAGLGVVGRDNFGVFPLRGKPLNVRDAKHDQIMKNEEIQNIKKIMGLQHNKDYKTVDSLRYGKLMLMTDQDHDGSHIKGLLINFLDHFFPSLLKVPNFLMEFITPIIRVTKGKQQKDFYSIPDYEQWIEAQPDKHKWVSKYYKGLGTSTDDDSRYYFSQMKKHVIPFSTTQAGDRELIELAFSKKKADERKEWLRQFRPGVSLDYTADEILFSDFINKELILFSMADNIRSIPSVADGLKPGQRKVIWACFRRKLKSEMKVSQLIGYVGEHSCYHHGEQSLTQTIVNLAQDYVGSNNLNLLMPNGQYGTRHEGGKDHASARYIFTQLSPLARAVLHPSDDPIITFLQEENKFIEPEWYMPILPFVLVNGAEGIGTGWSTSIPSYNPVDIVQNIRRLMDGEEQVPMLPWWRGFKGTVKKVAENKYDVYGLARKTNDTTIEIRELPIHKWTTAFKDELENMISGEKSEGLVKDYKEHSDNLQIHIVVSMSPKGMQKAEEQGLPEFFKLITKINTGNMMCFDFEGKIKKYNSPEEILEEFYAKRLAYYQKRKDYLAQDLQNQVDKVNNQARFVKMIVDKQLVVANRKRVEIYAELRKKDFKPIPKVAQAKEEGENEEVVEGEGQEGQNTDYDYLLGMAIWSLTKEKIEKLLEQARQKEGELLTLLEKTPIQLWNEDLDVFLVQWERMCSELEVKHKDAKGDSNKRAQKTLEHRKSLPGAGRRGGAGSDSDFKPFKPSKLATKTKVTESKSRAKQPAAKAKVDDSDDDDLPPPRPPKPSVRENLSDSDVELIPKPSKKAKAKAKVKEAPSPKRKSLNTADERDSDDSIYLKPAKKTKTQLTDFFDKVPGPSGAGKNAPARKASTSVETKTAAKRPAKPVLPSDDDEGEAPARIIPKRVARGTAKKYIEPSDSDDDDDENDVYLDDD